MLLSEQKLKVELQKQGESRDNTGIFSQGFDITLAKLFSIEEDDNIIVAD